MPLTFQAGAVLEMLMFCRQPAHCCWRGEDVCAEGGSTSHIPQFLQANLTPRRPAEGDPRHLLTPRPHGREKRAASWAEPNQPPPSSASSPQTPWSRWGREKTRAAPGPAPTSPEPSAPEPGCLPSCHLPPLTRNLRFRV